VARSPPKTPSGKFAQLSVINWSAGKEAVLAMLGPHDFFLVKELWSDTLRKHMEVARLDWQASDKHSIFGAILRHEPEYSNDVRSIECAYVEQERPGRSCVRPVDRQHVLDRLEYRQCISHWSEPAGNSENPRPIRHLARTGRQRSLQSRCRAALCQRSGRRRPRWHQAPSSNGPSSR
jgi:hypothetical protein